MLTTSTCELVQCGGQVSEVRRDAFKLLRGNVGWHVGIRLHGEQQFGICFGQPLWCRRIALEGGQQNVFGEQVAFVVTNCGDNVKVKPQQ